MPLFHLLLKGCVLEFPLGAGKKRPSHTCTFKSPRLSHAQMNTHACTCGTPTLSHTQMHTNTHIHSHTPQTYLMSQRRYDRIRRYGSVNVALGFRQQIESWSAKPDQGGNNLNRLHLSSIVMQNLFSLWIEASEELLICMLPPPPLHVSLQSI